MKKEPLTLPPADHILSADGLFARVYGSGAPLLLIHGNCCSGLVYAKLIPALLAHHYQLILPDLPGHGDGPAMPRGFLTDPQLASEYCFAVCDRLGIESFALCGHSLGGMIGLNMCFARQQRISSLILMDSFVDFTERPAELVNIKKFPTNPAIFQEEIDCAFSKGPGVLWHETYDVTDKVSHIRCPVLEMQGESMPDTDLLFENWKKTRRAHVPPQWQLVRIPNAGHFIQLEQPEIVSSLMLRFLHAQHKSRS